MLFAIHFQVLVIEELHQRLRHCQSQFAHDAQSLLFSICVWRRADAAGAVVNVTGIPVDYRQTFFSLNRNTEEIFHFARRIKLSTHFIRFTYIPDTFSALFCRAHGNIPLKIIGKDVVWRFIFPGSTAGRSALTRGSVRQSGRSLTLLVF
jgi:hypothetical protein